MFQFFINAGKGTLCCEFGYVASLPGKRLYMIASI